MPPLTLAVRIRRGRGRQRLFHMAHPKCRYVLPQSINRFETESEKKRSTDRLQAAQYQVASERRPNTVDGQHDVVHHSAASDTRNESR